MPGIGDLINHNNSLGIPITLFSNCLCLEESLIEILKRYNGNCVKTSLDGPQLINDSVRGNGVYKQVCATIMQLAENGVPVVVKVLKTKQLMGNVRELVLALQNIGVREIGFGDIIVHRDSPQSEVDRVLVDMDLELYWEIREAMKSSSIRLLDSIDYKDPLVNMCGCGDNLVSCPMNILHNYY